MRRQAIVLLTMTWLVWGLVPTPGGCAWAASEGAILKAATFSIGPAGAELVLQVDGRYSYKTAQPSPDTLLIDLAGVKTGVVARSQQWRGPAFTGYKLLQYRDASGEPVVRLQVGMKQADPFVVRQEGSTLRLLVASHEAATNPLGAAGLSPSPGTAAATPGPGTNPASVGSTSTKSSLSATESSVKAPTLDLSATRPVRVTNVIFDKRESGETIVDVATSGTTRYHVMTLRDPARLVVDVEGARNASHQKTFAADTLVLKDVRIGQFHGTNPWVVRVVADLKGNPVFDVHATPGGVRIELRPRGTVEGSPRSEVRSPQSSGSAATAQSTTVRTSVVAPAPASMAVTNGAAESEGQSLPAQAGPNPKTTPGPDVQSTLPPTAVTKQALAAPLPSPVSATPEALRAERAAKSLSLSKEPVPAAAQGAPPATPAAPTVGTAQEAKPTYTGELISLNLKDVDLKDFFRLIHEISGLNIIVDPNVSGTVTLVLDSTPWDQALDIVLKNNGLGKTLEGNVLRIAKVETLTAEQEATTKLAAARIEAAPLVTVFRPVNYAKAADIKTLLTTWAGGGALTRRGNVLVDARSNTLIISDVQSQIPVIEDIISKLDKKAKQVSIEARVVLATADFTRTLAASLLGGYGNAATTTIAGTGTGTSMTVPAPTTSAPVPIITTTSATSGGFGVASVTNYSARYFINAALAAAETRDQAKVISRPTIVTQNNVQGMVQQGVQVPVQTNINNTIAITYENATLQMTVTPQVTDDNNIFLTINVNNASLGASVTSAGPSINTQQATTQVLVPDGGTVIFGGVTVTNRSKSATYVPWLGSIPLLGHLFKTTNVQDSDQELLFFVSPKILAT